MEPSPYSERFTIACNHSQNQLGEVLGAVYLGGLAGKSNWRSPLCNSMLRYCTDTRHHLYWSVLLLWKSFVCEEQIKCHISLRNQYPNCVLYLGLELCFLWQNGKVVCPSMFLKQELNCACEE